MRILHTADWHLGKPLAGRSRSAEHEAYADELVALAQDVDLVLVAGDVFDTYNPPIEAEELFYDTMARLGDRGRRAVVVLAGNHDSPDRLAAPGPLSRTHGVYILGRPGDVLSGRPGEGRSGRVALEATAPSVLALRTADGARAVIAALPYPSEARLRKLLASTLEERSVQRGYAEAVGAAFAQLSTHFAPDAVNLAMSHLYVCDAEPSASERPLVGGAYQVPPSVFPSTADYVALGHLHTPQSIDAAPVPTWYSGAPLAYRFSEAGVRRTHNVVEIVAGGSARVEQVPISAGRPLVAWEVPGGVDAVVKRVEEGDGDGAFIDLSLEVTRPLTHDEVATLARLPRDFVRVRAVLPEALRRAVPAARAALPPSELFRAFVRTHAREEPDDALVRLFVELTEAARAQG